MNLVKNIPIPCYNCRAIANGRESVTRKPDGSLVTECTWRCPRCGSFLKRGTTKIEKPNENK